MDGLAAALLDGRGRITWWSRAAGELLGWSAGEILGSPARDLLAPQGTAAARPQRGEHRRPTPLRHRSGRIVRAEVRLLAAEREGSTLVVVVPIGTARPRDTESAPASAPADQEPLSGESAGVAVAGADAAGPQAARHRFTAAYRGAVGIGGSLDTVHSAQELVQALVPALGDLAAVDVREEVLAGRAPSQGYPGVDKEQLRRAAAKAARGAWPAPLVQVGELVPPLPDRPEYRSTAVGQEVFAEDRETVLGFLGDDPVLLAKMMPVDMRSALACSIYHRGHIFGYVLVWRTRSSVPFDDSDAEVLKEFCARCALAIDNALRYVREQRTAVVLQRSLLPAAATQSTAAETAGIYLPASGNASVGGDWFDAFGLSSLRLALVVGDVIGHGLQATATMARLRTAVQTLADLDLPPDELLTHLDDLVQRMRAEADAPDTVGATCLFAVYDPVSGVCRMASAGHPPPAVVLPDGTVSHPELLPGPPLGVGDNPFEVTSVTLPPGSVLALFTDGLLGHDIDAGLARVRSDLAELGRADEPLHRTGQAVIDRCAAAAHPEDDITLLLARTRTVHAADTAAWEYPADPAAVQDARADTSAQMTAWGLHEALFATELIVSELVTNAIRYAGGPIVLRLVRDRVLVCEVSDPSNTQPRLRRARSTDEGGRGLFLVAQLSSRWGSRYGHAGKTIWTEQDLG
ncbi:SpoIIE family protein phosphatase [Streptomyces sp. NA04227]|nr:SpoIIE family protein phosphatase [Streptomyces sp. NA04227]